jgi:hypothetical protein
MPHFAKMEVNPAKKADNTAAIIQSILFSFVTLSYYTTLTTILQRLGVKS